MQPYPEIPLLGIYTTDKNNITTASHVIEKKKTHFHKQGILQWTLVKPHDVAFHTMKRHTATKINKIDLKGGWAAILSGKYN